MRRTAVALALALATTAAGPAQAADPPTPGGCQAFGKNVASLGTKLGPVFGQTASEMAQSGPRAFPDNVVKPEQERFCP